MSEESAKYQQVAGKIIQIYHRWAHEGLFWWHICLSILLTLLSGAFLHFIIEPVFHVVTSEIVLRVIVGINIVVALFLAVVCADYCKERRNR
jgi:hypothetical protein